jgi:hypothetical protein
MNRKYIYSIISIFVLSLVGCTHREDVITTSQTIHMTITATTETGNDTKTLMAEPDEDQSRSILWEPEDSIKLMCDPYQYASECKNTGHIFRNTNNDISHTASFEGEVDKAYNILALYPHNINVGGMHWNDGLQCNTNTINLPKVQHYRENNFDKNCFPMAAFKVLVSDNDYRINGSLEFKNLCGILVLNLLGEDKIRSISMTARYPDGNIAALSGLAELKRDESSFYWPHLHGGSPSVTLECPDVQLDPTVPTPFHIVLPPNTYSSFDLAISTSDGKMMTVTSEKELVINRSKAKHTTPLAYTETITIDLSEKGTANSYIVSEAGVYSFDASVIGNGSAGIIPFGSFHTSDPKIEPTIAKLIWEDTPGLITGISLNRNKKTISFATSGEEGNALIAAMDNDSTILWSWHMWCTDRPADHTYYTSTGQTIAVHDRNLGATRSDRGNGDEWKESIGLSYQWGRKDPFTREYEQPISFRLTLEESIKHPTYSVSQDGSWETDVNTLLWTDDTKTIYDPCPPGYKVAPKETWSSFTTTGANVTNPSQINWTGYWDYGFYFIYDGTNAAWYPSIYMGPDLWISESECECWSSTCCNYNYDTDGYWAHSFRLYARYGSEIDVRVNPVDIGSHNLSRAVRCVADSDYKDPSSPEISGVDVVSKSITTLTVKSTLTHTGDNYTVQNVGFVYGTTPEIDIDNGQVIYCDEYSFTSTLTGLEPFTEYYVKSFVHTDKETKYSSARRITTLFDGNCIDLSSDGTANCYIISKPETYKIKAHRGNSDEYISGISEIEILWESFGTEETPDRGDLIEKVTLDNDLQYIGIKTSDEYRKGNAVIAAKDKDGITLWSWHLWFTDEPQEHTYRNFAGSLMDRNLGATSTTPGDPGANGLLYQWGRKDPFPGSSSTTENIKAKTNSHWPAPVYYTEGGTVEYTIAHPTTFIKSSWDNGMDWASPHNNDLWGATKTKYDPCPYGWAMATGGNDSTWDDANITLPALDNQNDGYMIEVSSGTFSWYPLSGWLDHEGNICQVSYNGEIWSRTPDHDSNGFGFAYFRDGAYNPTHSKERVNGLSVRCQKIQ